MIGAQFERGANGVFLAAVLTRTGGGLFGFDISSMAGVLVSLIHSWVEERLFWMCVRVVCGRILLTF